MAEQISTRISFRWLPDSPSEPTDTLVFNVGSYFMDLRVLKTDGSIEWGMAGERQILSKDPCLYCPNGLSAITLLINTCERTVTCRWIKLIDSLGPSDPDEAMFTKLANGDYLETGSMPSPDHNGVVTKFEEVWRRGIPIAGSKFAWIIQSVDGKTFMGRVGGSYLALSEVNGGVFNARREEWDEQEGWIINYAIGNVEELPRLASIGDQIKSESSWSTGDKIVVSGNDYIVRGFENL